MAGYISQYKKLCKNILNKDGTVSGNGVNGRWELSGEHYIRLTVNGTNYTGVVLQQWDDGLKKYVMTFSAISRNGNVTIWAANCSLQRNNYFNCFILNNKLWHDYTSCRSLFIFTLYKFLLWQAMQKRRPTEFWK